MKWTFVNELQPARKLIMCVRFIEVQVCVTYNSSLVTKCYEAALYKHSM